jgi:hypothetical protein
MDMFELALICCVFSAMVLLMAATDDFSAPDPHKQWFDRWEMTDAGQFRDAGDARFIRDVGLEYMDRVYGEAV